MDLSGNRQVINVAKLQTKGRQLNSHRIRSTSAFCELPLAAIPSVEDDEV